jgi:ABC-type sulfate transport system substrate-binding protein
MTLRPACPWNLRIKIKTLLRSFLLVILGLSLAAVASGKESKLLNVSDDPTRELYQDFNQAFAQ